MTDEEFKKRIRSKLTSKGYFGLTPNERAKETVKALARASEHSKLTSEKLQKALLESRGGGR